MECPVRQQARARPDAVALVVAGRILNYRELDREIAGWVARLSRRGVRAGDRVAVLSWNRPELVFLFHAAARLQAALAPLNARLTAAEVVPLAGRLGARVTLAEAALAARLPEAEPLERLAGEAPGAAEDRGELDPASVQAVLFTSGTTGAPKAAQLTVGNFQASADASAANLSRDVDQRWLACLPLFHVGGLAMVARCARYGAALRLETGFDPDRVNDAIDRGEVTHLSLVATALARLLEAREGRSAPAMLRAILVGGGPVPPALAGEARRVGLPVLQTYGLTEACSQVATERPGGADGHTAGPPLPGLRVRIVDDARRVLPADEIGEIEVAGPTVMRGYLDDPAATDEALRDGWLRTRDVGRLDRRGRLTVLARRRDLILSGGENVYPAEIEAVLLQHPGVRDAVVVAKSDATWGQVPWAMIAVRSGHAPGELDAWCRARLAAFKVPKGYVVVDAIPRNAGGKPDRQVLERWVAEHTTPPRNGSNPGA